MTLETLKALMENGKFHHATYRDFGTLWEGLWIYVNDSRFPGIRYTPAGSFGKNSPDLNAAEEMVKGTGVSVGAYGRG